MKRLFGLLVVTGLVTGCGAEYVTDKVSSLRRHAQRRPVFLNPCI